MCSPSILKIEEVVGKRENLGMYWVVFNSLLSLWTTLCSHYLHYIGFYRLKKNKIKVYRRQLCSSVPTAVPVSGTLGSVRRSLRTDSAACYRTVRLHEALSRKERRRAGNACKSYTFHEGTFTSYTYHLRVLEPTCLG